MAHEEQLHAMRRVVDSLPAADREILHLRFAAGLSFAGIAAALGEPLGTVLARSHRAIGKLRGLLGGVPGPGQAGQPGQPGRAAVDAKAGDSHD
jgi:RNA polymerase sigma-70 factor (ECF subfamily)